MVPGTAILDILYPAQYQKQLCRTIKIVIARTKLEKIYGDTVNILSFIGSKPY